MTDSLSDDALVAQAQGDVEVFTMLYQRHLTRVYRYLRSRVQSDAEAEDLTSQTFIAVLENLDTYQQGGTFVAWVLRIAHNKWIDAYRRNKPIISIDDLSEKAINQQTPEAVIQQKLQLEDVQTAIEQLNPEWAEPLRLRLFAELTYAEIGELTGKSEGAIRTMLWRAVKALRAYLNQQHENVS
ncbi:MAG: sigma-70 family RNA polymerase sigma factor [Chloroflexota bacterium]